MIGVRMCDEARDTQVVEFDAERGTLDGRNPCGEALHLALTGSERSPITRITIGIDGGLGGAVAIITEQSDEVGLPTFPDVAFFDTPIAELVSGTKSKPKKRRDYLPVAMADILRPYLGIAVVAIEQSRPMPDQGVVSTFSTGKGFGLWLGICAGLGLSVEVVTPQTWKGALMAGQPKEKDASRAVAMGLFPQARKDLALKKHHDRADALLIAEWRRRQG